MLGKISSFSGPLSTVSKKTSVDVDAQAFITAASITDATQKSAINQLVIDFKSYGIWTKMKAIYPFVGATSTTHKWNLKDPRDLDAAFRLVFSGGWTHSSTGALPNGTNGWADTFLGTNVMSLDSIHLSYYSRTNNTSGTVEMGVLKSTPNSYTDLGVGYLTNGAFIRLNNGGGVGFVANAGSNGFFQGNRIISSTTKLYKNGISIQTLTAASNATTTFPISIGAVNNIDTGAKTFYSNKECAFSSIGDGLTDTEAANFYTAVQAYQTTLGRSIGPQTVSDPDAQAFVTAANIEDQVQANAVNTLVIDMKAANIWSKMKAIYPFVGGTAASHKWNLKDPQDLDAAFRLVFNGGMAHSSTGILFNGVNGYGNTFLNGTAFTTNHLSFYSRTLAVNTQIEMGVFEGPPNKLLHIRPAANYVAGDTFSLVSFTTTTDARGFWLGTKRANNNREAYRNGVSQATSTVNDGTGFAIHPIYIGARNNNNTGIDFPTSKECAFASLGDGLTDTEAANFYTAVQTYQTTLSRQV